MADPLLAIENLCIDFRTREGVVRAVHDVSFSIGEREILGVVGESGSGKTLTMLAVTGLITDPNARVSGSIRFRGQELLGLSHAKLRSLRGSAIAMIFQDPMAALTPVHSIGWQIVEQIRAHEKLSARAAKSRAVLLLGQMGMPAPAEQFHRYPHQLSGGMRQRAMIAMALSCNPALLIADEPTTALDVTVQAQILALLQRLQADFGSSILLVTHDMGVVASIAGRAIVMYAGRLMETGPAEAMFAHPAHPYTRALLASIPPLSGEKPRRLPAIPGMPPLPSSLPPGCPFAPRCPRRFSPCDAMPPMLACGTQSAACHLLAAPA